MSQVTFTILFLAFLTAGFLAWYFSHKSREKERLMLIEKGIEVPEVERGVKFTFRFPWLKIGILITFIAIGLTVGIIVREMTVSNIAFEPIMMMLFGGLGMILAHFAGRGKK